MNTRDTRGFTLIELLVVIAIIGILSSVVLASLNTARGKGSDAAIKEQLASIRPQAEIYYDSNNDYGATGNCSVTSAGVITAISGVCTGIQADPTASNQIKAAASAAGATVYFNTIQTPAAWAAWAPLKATAGTYWCVDSIGTSKQENSAPATTVTVCP